MFIVFAPHDHSVTPKYFFILILLGLVNAVLWTKILCTTLVDLISVIGAIYSLPTTYLGLTIIAIGNAIQDLFTTLAIAQQGHAILAITGGMVGQFFGLLVGFGVSMLKKTLTTGQAQPFDLFNPDKIQQNGLELIVVFVTFLTLILVFIYVSCNKMRLDNRLANILLTIYGGFFVASSYIAVKQALHSQ